MLLPAVLILQARSNCALDSALLPQRRTLSPKATVVVQDPAQRPSAAALQQDPFVRGAAIPASLPRRMAEHVASQRPVRPSRGPVLKLALLYHCWRPPGPTCTCMAGLMRMSQAALA